MTEIDPIELTKACRNQLAPFCAAVYPKFQLPRHLQIVVKALQMVEDPESDVQKLMIFAPPRHGKSVLTSQLFPAWYHGKHPDHMIMTACHTQQLATSFGGKIKVNIETPQYKTIFPEYIIRTDSDAKHEWKTTMNGEFFAAGVGGGIAGRGGHLIIIDDPIKSAEDAKSEVMRAKLHDWYQADLETRGEPDAKIIIIQTRWHEDDLAGWLLNPDEQEEIDDWHILDLPAIAERDEGWRKEGEALWPERFTLEYLEKLKRKLGQWVWVSLYQQKPTALEGTYFKRDWWQRYNWNPTLATQRDQFVRVLTKPYRIWQSWDTALEDGKDNDYSTCGTYLETASGDYLLDVWRGKVLAHELVATARELAIYWRADGVLVEKKASGHGLIQSLKRLLPGVPIIPFTPKMSKEERAKLASPYIQSGMIHLPYQAPWLKDYENEMAAFPMGTNDDQVDQTSQYVIFITEKRDLESKLGLEGQPQGDINPYEV